MSISFVVFLQILFVVIIIIHGDDTFDCTGYEDDSYHPISNADDCRHYWHCIYVNTVYMHAVRRVCPAGTEFDATLRQCETSSLVDCIPSRSPHLPRTTSTTKAWKWKYSKLFSRIHWKPTIPVFITTRRHQIFDLGDSPEDDITTMIMPESETTEQIQVLPYTLSHPATTFSLEQLSKNLQALVLNHRPNKQRSAAAAKFFRIDEPENEAEISTSTTKQRTRRTRSTTQSTSIQTTTQLPLTIFPFTTEATTTTTTTTILTTTTITSPLTSTSMTTVMTQPDVTININSQPRINSQRRRDNMTLYILTSDEHKIRRFSVNHTRGILINCNQLRRRLLGRRRLRDLFQTTTNHTSIIKQSLNSSNPTFHYNILLLMILSFFFLTELVIIT